jgi:hypothetical protein
MNAEGETQADAARLRDVAALLQAAGVQARASQLPGLAEDYEQLRGMAAMLRSAEDPGSWPYKR